MEATLEIIESDLTWAMKTEQQRKKSKFLQMDELVDQTSIGKMVVQRCKHC